MQKTLAIVTGFGNLSEEVVRLAEERQESYIHYVVKPWLPKYLNPWNWRRSFASRSGTIEINPFHLAEIEHELQAKSISEIFFTGDFPPDRFTQASLAMGNFRAICDAKGWAYFSETPTNLSLPVRFFLTLQRLLEELGIKPLLSCEIFPELNVHAGQASNRAVPPQILNRIDQLLSSAATEIMNSRLDSTRLSQAVIIDDGQIIEQESRGTNDLIRRFKRKRSPRKFPFLLKPPSLEFHPALDQPTLGPTTVDKCNEAGIRGIMFCAETTTIVHRDQTLERANQLDVFIYAIPFKQLREVYVQTFPQTWAQTATISVQRP